MKIKTKLATAYQQLRIEIHIDSNKLMVLN